MAQATSVDDPQNHYIENNRGYGSYRRYEPSMFCLDEDVASYRTVQEWLSLQTLRFQTFLFYIHLQEQQYSLLHKGRFSRTACSFPHFRGFGFGQERVFPRPSPAEKLFYDAVLQFGNLEMLTHCGARGQYFMPCDGTERARLDMMHTLLKAARDKDKRLLDAPFYECPDQNLQQEPHRVLDLGCGTGIWCLDMAAKHRNTHFVGVDLYNLGPRDLLGNVDLRAPFDYENPWAIGEHSWDVVHLQMGLGSVMDWSKLYQKIVRHLKPGGWFENVEIDWQPRCDDGTLPANGRLIDWWENRIAPAYDAVSRPLRYRENTGQEMAKAGFINIVHRVYRIPLNGWSSDRAENRSGTWWNLSMSSGPDYGCGIEALSLAALTRMHEWSADHARRFCEEVLMESRNPNVHAYNNLHVWWATVPGPFR